MEGELLAWIRGAAGPRRLGALASDERGGGIPVPGVRLSRCRAFSTICGERCAP